MKRNFGKRRLVVVIATAGAFLLFLLTRPAEPSYSGRSLSGWLTRLWNPNPEIQTEAEKAIRSMGTNAVPHLIRMLPKRNANWKRQYNRWIMDCFGNNWARARHFLFDEHSAIAAQALGIIGPDARDSVPFLIQNMTNYPMSASSPSTYDLALSFIGADAVLPLAQALSHPDQGVRFYAASALGHMEHTNLVLAVPQLLKVVSISDAETRHDVARLLGYMRDDERAQSTLIRLLSDTSSDVRCRAAYGLGSFGDQAVAALPALFDSLGHSDTNFQDAVRRAIVSIDTNLTVEGIQIRRRDSSGNEY